MEKRLVLAKVKSSSFILFFAMWELYNALV